MTDMFPLLTFREMCEAIAEVHNACRAAGYESMIGSRAPDALTWEEVWNYSPTGELFMLHVWYAEVPAYREALTKVCP